MRFLPFPDLLCSKKKGITDVMLAPPGLAELVRLVKERKISGRIAKDLLPTLLGEWRGGVWELVEREGMQAINDPEKIAVFVR